MFGLEGSFRQIRFVNTCWLLIDVSIVDLSLP